MATIAFPAIRAPIEFSLDLMNFAYASGSGETLAGQIVQTLGAPWVITMTWTHFSPAEAQIMQAFIDQMDGIANLTQLGNIRRPAPVGTITGAPLVDGAGQTGTTLNLKGMTPGQTFEAGDMLGRTNLLYRVCAPATVDGAGKAALTIRPAMVVATANEEIVTLAEPKTYFRLKNNFTPIVTDGRIGRHWARGVTLEFVESPP